MSPTAHSPRAGILGPGAAGRWEPRLQALLSHYGPPLGYEALDAPTDWGLYEDMLEYLPKAGFVGVELFGTASSHAHLRSEWQASAQEAGCVDTLAFPATDNRLPLGHNLTISAGRRVLGNHGCETRLESVLVLGAGVTARSMISVLAESIPGQVRIFHPDPDRAQRMFASATGSEIDSRRVVLVDDLASTEGTEVVIDLLPRSESVAAWQVLRSRLPSPLTWAIRRPTEDGAPRPRAGIEIDPTVLRIEKTACARELFTGEALAEGVTALVYAAFEQEMGDPAAH